MADPIPLYPDNDFGGIHALKDVNLATGKVGKLTAGTVTAFLATTNTPDATAAAVSLSVTCTKVEDGKWIVFFDATILAFATLDPIFAADPTACYLIIVEQDGTRSVVDLVYTPVRQAKVA